MTARSAVPGLEWADPARGPATAAAAGSWTVANAAALDGLVGRDRVGTGTGDLAIDLSAVSAIDTFGACLLDRLIGSARAAGRTVAVTGMPERYRALLDAVNLADDRQAGPRPVRHAFAGIEAFGRVVVGIGVAFGVFVSMLGAVGAAAGRVIVHPRRFRFTATVHQLDRVGFRAIPIIVLITLLIGAIIAQQGIFNFRKFGAESYVVDLVGILVLRELGVLVVAIMVAGRSGSSYTAELGSMTMREEIDALRTMGLDPVEVLVLPRVLALVLALPILAFIGAMAALTGGGKSVLMRTILGLLAKRGGTIRILGSDPDALGEDAGRGLERRWGVLFQQGALFSSLTARQNVEFPMREYLDLPGRLRTEVALTKLRMVGFAREDMEKFPAELSGGMTKRVALARSLALEPDIVFLDEPTSGLDPIAASDFDILIKTLQRTLGLTVFMATHDLDSLEAVCDRVAALAAATSRRAPRSP